MKISRYLPLIGITIFIYILWATGASKILGSLRQINIKYFFLALLLTLPLLVIKALKWQVLIKACDANYPLANCLSSWLIGFFVGLITPGRIGDLSRSLYLKESEDISLGKSLTTVFLDRIIDISILFCLAIFGILMFVFSYAIEGTYPLAIGILFLSFLIFLFIITREDLIRGFLKPFYEFFIPEKHKSQLSNHFKEFYSGFGLIWSKKKALVYATSLSLINWLVSIFMFYVLAIALNLRVSYQFLVFIVPPTILVEILPISFSGLGTRDAALIFFLSFISIPAEFAVSLSLSILSINYIIALLGFLIWTRNPMKF
ncbi:MAG: lysylphosphatidylglycerol synthase transmembrane domain-containing protein [Candidatus Hydrothermarchaeales archaeon]